MMITCLYLVIDTVQGESLKQKAQAELLRVREHISELETHVADLEEQNRALLTELEKAKLITDSLQQQKSEIMNAILEAEKNTVLLVSWVIHSYSYMYTVCMYLACKLSQFPC